MWLYEITLVDKKTHKIMGEVKIVGGGESDAVLRANKELDIDPDAVYVIVDKITSVH